MTKHDIYTNVIKATSILTIVIIKIHVYLE